MKPLLDELGFSRNLPYDFEDMIHKLVFRIKEGKVREQLEAAKKAEDNVEMMQALQRLYELGKENSEYCVEKYETIYNLNKRNISDAHALAPEDAAMARAYRQQFYEEHFKQQQLLADAAPPPYLHFQRKPSAFKSVTKIAMTGHPQEAPVSGKPEPLADFETEEFKAVKPKIDVG